MQVVSGSIGRERVHYEAPVASRLKKEMRAFLVWFNSNNAIDPVLKAGVAHLWFVTIHPFDDGNAVATRFKVGPPPSALPPTRLAPAPH